MVKRKSSKLVIPGMVHDVPAAVEITHPTTSRPDGSTFMKVLGIEDLKDLRLMSIQCVCEVMGSFLLCTPIFFSGLEYKQIGYPNIFWLCCCIGMVAGATIEAFGHVSGSHLNPCVSIAMFVGGEMKLIKALVYIGCQYLGTLGGTAFIISSCGESYAYWNLKHGNETWFNMSLMHHRFRPTLDVTENSATLIMLETFGQLLWVVLSLASHDVRRVYGRGAAAMAFSFGITAAALVCCRATGAGMSAAKTFAVTYVLHSYKNDFNYVYNYACIYSGILGGLLFRLVLLEPYNYLT